MSKNWEVTIIYAVKVAVENAKDSESAVEFALDRVSGYMDSEYNGECDAREVSDVAEWESVKRHSDFVDRESLRED